MDKNKKGFIRYLKSAENISVSAIARRIGADRKTVRRALTESQNQKVLMTNMPKHQDML